MVTYFCSNCADADGLRPAPPTTEFLQSQYQRAKHEKHTNPSSSHDVQSVFDEPSEDYYRQTVDEAFRQGALHVTSRGTDILFCPSTQSSIGYKQRWGELVNRQDTVRVVKTDDEVKVHAFLNASSDHSGHRCDKCGGPLF